MGIFNVGPTEILVVMIVVLLIFGPDQMSEIAKKIGSAQRSLNKTYDTFNEQMMATLKDSVEGETKPAAANPALPAPTVSAATNPVPPAPAEPTISNPPATLPGSAEVSPTGDTNTQTPS